MAPTDRHADAGALPRDPVELKHLILKLRWIGDDAEAERLRQILGRTAPGQICIEERPATD